MIISVAEESPYGLTQRRQSGHLAVLPAALGLNVAAECALRLSVRKALGWIGDRGAVGSPGGVAAIKSARAAESDSCGLSLPGRHLHAWRTRCDSSWLAPS